MQKKKNQNIDLEEGNQLCAEDRKRLEFCQLHDIMWRMQRKCYAKLKRAMQTKQISRDTLILTQDFSQLLVNGSLTQVFLFKI